MEFLKKGGRITSAAATIGTVLNIKPVLNSQLNVREFYQQLRDGANAKTSAVTPGYFEEKMKKSLNAGNDILYIGFSSGLSATYNNGVMVINELKDEFPNRKIMHIDTFCASVGQGLLVYYAALMKQNDASIEEVYTKIESMKQKINHQVTVNDLFFLKRGGRIDATTAIVGSVLKFKPIINVGMYLFHIVIVVMMQIFWQILSGII